MNLLPQPTPRRAKLFGPQQSFRSRLSELPQFEETKQGYKSHLLDISKDAARKSKEPTSMIFKTNISHFQPLNTEGDSETTRETCSKETHVSQRPVLKLENLFTNINSVHGTDVLKLRMARSKGEVPGNLSNYLGYLDSSSNRDIESFRKKMVAKLEPHKVEARNPQGLNKDWVESFLPLEIKESSNVVSESPKKVRPVNLPEINTSSIEMLSSKRVRPVNLPEISSIEGISPKAEFRLENKSPMAKSTRSRRLGLGKLKRISPEKKRSIENRSDAAIALKLAEEVARNYRFYQENAVKNRELQGQINEILEQEDLMEIFHGKVYRKLALAMRIYRHMVELVQKSSNMSRVLSVDKVGVNNSQWDQFDALNCQARLIRPRYDAYIKINEKLQEVNLEFRVQGVQSLEGKLLQAHEELKSRKMMTLERMSKVSSEKYLKIKSQCEDLERLVPMHGDVSRERRERKEREEANQAVSSSFTKEARTVNNKLNCVVRNLQDNLLEPFKEGMM